MIGDLVIMLEKKYDVPKEKVLMDLIKVEQVYHNKVLLDEPNSWRFDKCYFLLASGYLSKTYREREGL